MGDFGGIVSWLFFLLHFAVLAAVIGAALVMVRPANAQGAYLLAAAAGVDLLVTCCGRAATIAMRYMEAAPISTGLSCVSMLSYVITTALIAFAFVTMARLVTHPKTPG